MKLPKVPQRTTPGFAFSMVDRALLDCLGERQFRQDEMKAVVLFLGADPPECVFCGSADIARWDHLVAIKQGGETVIGNMVPACSRCDDSKRDVPYEDWMLSDAKHSPKTRGLKDVKLRIARIRRYVSHFDYSPKPLAKRLSKREAQRLAKIRRLLGAVRRDVDDLIDDYRTERTMGVSR